MKTALLLAAALVLAGCSSASQPRSATAVPQATPRAAVAAAVESRDAHLADYRDPATGVSFEYPDIWIESARAPGYFGPAFATPTVAPRATFTFSPKGNLYEKTLLLGLTFSYFAVPAANAQVCVAEAKRSTDAAHVHSVNINGTPFTEVGGGNAGMCHSQATQIDVTWKNGQCLAFERDFNYECEGAGDGKQKLTVDQGNALQRHLDQVMQSVHIIK